MKYDRYDLKSLAGTFPAQRKKFKNDESYSEKTIAAEVTDVNGNLVEIRLNGDEYLIFDIYQLREAILQHEIQYVLQGDRLRLYSKHEDKL